MKLIALTGGIACGKTTAAQTLRELGAAVVDADAVSRALTAPGGEALPAVFAAFGKEVQGAENTLNRTALAALVFGNPQARETLDRILHPMIEKQMKAEIAAYHKKGFSVVFLDVPLLYEAGMEALADEVWCISAPEEIQIRRMAARDGFSREQALLRIRSQWPLCQKESLADQVIFTDRSLPDVKAEIARLYQHVSERSSEG